MKKGILKIFSSLILSGALTVSSFLGFSLVQAPAQEVVSPTVLSEDEHDDVDVTMYFEDLLKEAKDLEIGSDEKEFFDIVYKSYGDYVKKVGLNLTEQELKESVNLIVLLNYESCLGEVFTMALDHLGLDNDTYIEILSPVFDGLISDSEKEFYKLILNTYSFDSSKLEEKDMKAYEELKVHVKKLVDVDDIENEEILTSLIWNLANSNVKLSTELIINVMVTLDIESGEDFLKLVGPYAEKFEKYISNKAISMGYLGKYYIDSLMESVNLVELEELIKQLSDKKITSDQFFKSLIDNVDQEFISQEKSDDIIRVLYSTLFLREPDDEGFAFWVKEYDEDGSKNAFKNIAYRMMETEEFKNVDFLSEFDIV